MINSTLCYITRGDEVLMLHRVKKKNDVNHDKWIGSGGNSGMWGDGGSSGDSTTTTGKTGTVTGNGVNVRKAAAAFSMRQPRFWAFRESYCPPPQWCRRR